MGVHSPRVNTGHTSYRTWYGPGPPSSSTQDMVQLSNSINTLACEDTPHWYSYVMPLPLVLQVWTWKNTFKEPPAASLRCVISLCLLISPHLFITSRWKRWQQQPSVGKPRQAGAISRKVCHLRPWRNRLTLIDISGGFSFSKFCKHKPLMSCVDCTIFKSGRCDFACCIWLFISLLQIQNPTH